MQTAGKSFLLYNEEDCIEFLLTGAKRRLWLRVGSSVPSPPSQGKETVLSTASKVMTRTSGELICLDQEIKELLQVA